MISSKEVCEIINEGEKNLKECYLILNNLKINRNTENIHLFQPKLATALFKLNKCYRDIVHEEKRLIKNKKNYKNKWFEEKLGTLKSYKEAINKTIEIAKGIGDSFAWIFYIKKANLITQHQEHQKITHTPPGIGGEAELQFIRNVYKFEGLFVLYHGITSFLRVGDVSLIDLLSGEVVALGEMKAVKKSDKELNISLHIIGSNKIEKNLSKIKKGENPTKLPLNIELKLKNQLKNMGKFFKFDYSPIGKEDILNGYNISNLQKLIKVMSRKKIAIDKISESLLIFGIKNNRKTLEKRIFNEPKLNNRIFEKVNFTNHALSICDKESKENSIILGELSTNYFTGGTPIFWWPLEDKVLEKLFFKEFIFITIYNPYYFIKKLREAGFKIIYTGVKWYFNISIDINGGNFSINNIDYFINAIIYHLMKEESIIEILLRLIEKAKNGEIPGNSKTMLELNHYVF